MSTIKKMNNSKIINIFDNEKDSINDSIKTFKEHKIKINDKINNKQNRYNIISIFIFLLFIIFVLIIELYKYKRENNDLLNIIKIKPNLNNKLLYLKNTDNQSIINIPILPENEKEIIKKNYFKSNYNNSNIRYHFVEDFMKRKTFKINFSYLPYNNIDKSKTYEENANYIYESTGMLNITKLDIAYYNKNIKDSSKFNNIHLSMGHDANYILLSLISIASILNTTNKDTFIHFHFVLLGCKFEDMKPIIALNEIYENIEFIFYDGKQVEYDFLQYGAKETRGIGDYAKFLIPEIVNNTNRILILDSADIIVKKDLSEIYYFDLEDNYFGFALDIFAGKKDNYYVFAKNNFYGNIGACLVDVRLFRRDNLYMAGYFVRYAYNYLPCPTQEMFFLTSQYKFKYFPLAYNYPEFFKNDADYANKIYDSYMIKFYMDGQKNTPFKYTLEEIIEAYPIQVIAHLYTTKPYLKIASKENGKIWVNYAKLAKAYEKLKQKYPDAVKFYDK